MGLRLLAVEITEDDGCVIADGEIHITAGGNGGVDAGESTPSAAAFDSEWAIVVGIPVVDQDAGIPAVLNQSVAIHMGGKDAESRWEGIEHQTAEARIFGAPDINPIAAEKAGPVCRHLQAGEIHIFRCGKSKLAHRDPIGVVSANHRLVARPSPCEDRGEAEGTPKRIAACRKVQRLRNAILADREVGLRALPISLCGIDGGLNRR